MTPLLDVTFPLLVPSVANLREHWRVARARVREQRDAARTFLLAHAMRTGMSELRSSEWGDLDLFMLGSLRILVTRIAPRRLRDEHDNLRAALKAVVDGIALALGVDDGDPRLSWEYGQRKTAHERDVRELPSVRVQIWRKEEP